MRRIIGRGSGGLFVCLAVLALGLTTPSADAITLDFSSEIGSNVTFVSTAAGADFTFEDESGTFNDFQIVFTSGDGSALGLFGDIEGTFSYTSAGILVAGAQETAAVSGSGTLSIWDGVAFALTATVNWVDIETDGTAGVTNIGGAFSLTGITYAGANADLIAMTIADGIVTSTFQLASSPSLTSIASAPVGTTTVYNSYSGTMTVVPEPATLGLLGMGLIGMAIRRKRISI